MNQIALGDESGWTVIAGQSVAAPFRQAAAFFAHDAGSALREKVEVQLVGTPAQISAALNTLEMICLRAGAYADATYAYPQLLRFQPEAGGAYYYAKIQDLWLDANPDHYISHQRGSMLVRLHYTRPNCFDGDMMELPLTGRSGTDVSGGFDLINHTDAHSAHGSTALVKAQDALTDLPAPLRIELENTYAVSTLKDILVGVYHHPTVSAESLFFANANQISGGAQYTNAGAINETYRTVAWASSDWTPVLNYGITAADIADLDGRAYRPILHLYTAHAYPDLHLKIRLMRGVFTLQSCEPVYADPDFGYILFPPIQLPPNPLLRETLPHHVEIQIDALKENGAASSLSIDQLALLPLDASASFQGFYPMGQDDTLIDDSFRELSNVRYSAAGSETIAHIRQGGPLLLYPNQNSRLFFVLSNESNTIDIMRTARVRVYYRPRVRLL